LEAEPSVTIERFDGGVGADPQVDQGGYKFLSLQTPIISSFAFFHDMYKQHGTHRKRADRP